MPLETSSKVNVFASCGSDGPLLRPERICTSPACSKMGSARLMLRAERPETDARLAADALNAFLNSRGVRDSQNARAV